MSTIVHRNPNERVARTLARVPPEDQAISSVTVGELLYGALRLGSAGVPLLGRIERRILQPLTILPFDEAAARVYARIRVDLEAAGTPIELADTQIAAIALRHSLTVVTANTRHFARVPGLRVENWMAPGGTDDAT